MDSIDYDFSKFGPSSRQDIALRALAFDDDALPLSRRPSRRDSRRVGRRPADQLLAARRGGRRPRISLADSRFAADHRAAAEAAAASPRISARAQSALDFSWMDDVDPSRACSSPPRGC